MPRLEIRLSDGEAARLDELRGGVPKGTWIKQRLGLVVEQASGEASRRTGHRVGQESSGTPDARSIQGDNSPVPARRPVQPAEGTPLPKIAPRRWI